MGIQNKFFWYRHKSFSCYEGRMHSISQANNAPVFNFRTASSHLGIVSTDSETEHARCLQKFPDWPPGARTENGTALCQQA